MVSIQKIIYYFLALIVAFASAGFMYFSNIKTVSAHDPNNLISNGEFIAWQTWDADGIQSFLNTKGGTRLRTFREGGLTAAQIIANAARMYGINPVVILSTIQKEESLVESNTNFDYRVRWAMGYGVCDGCDSNDPALQHYAGFTNQVYSGTWQLKINYTVWAANGSDWNVGKTMMIDGQAVRFSNHATSALYRYTPHLSGNESFVRVYSSYKTYVPPATYNSRLITKVGPTYLRPGQRATYYAYFQNTGTSTWLKNSGNPMHLGNSSPRDRDSKLFGGNVRWNMLQNAVYRNQVAVFSITIVAPQETGSYVERLQPVMEQVTWFDAEVTFNIQVGGSPVVTKGSLVNGQKVAPSPINKLDLIRGKNTSVNGFNTQENYNAQYITKAYAPSNLVPGQRLTLYVYYKNTGNTTWYRDGANPAHLGTSDPQDRSSILTGGNVRWNMLQPSIAPGQVGIFTISITVPDQKGSYTEKFRPVIEYKTWMGDEVTYNYTIR